MPEDHQPPNETGLPDRNRDLDSAEALYRSGDEAGAFSLFEKLANSGSAPAMTWLGSMYLNGNGAAADTDAALQWFSKAAEMGDAEAMDWLGYMYFSGKGVAIDMDAARHWYLKAAEAGDAGAMSRLAHMYLSGASGAIDMTAARHWYSKAAESGDAHGQQSFGTMLHKAGEREEAERWYRKAADQGHVASINWLSEMNASKMLKEKRYDEAVPILTKAANTGSAWSHEALADVYWHGRGVHKDRVQSIQHYEAAYSGGRHSLANWIGIMHFRAGHPQIALDWLRRDTQRPTSSLYWQHRILKAHPNMERQPGESDELLGKAADSGHMLAKRDMGLRMLTGKERLAARLQGLRAWFGALRYALRLVMDDPNDERLR
jgi:TPR repeat protein